MNRLPWSAGQALFWRQVYVTTQAYGPVQLALGRPQGRQAYWCVVSDEPTEVKTFAAYGWRFDIAEHCFADTSNGVQLESSLLRSAHA